MCRDKACRAQVSTKGLSTVEFTILGKIYRLKTNLHHIVALYIFCIVKYKIHHVLGRENISELVN